MFMLKPRDNLSSENAALREQLSSIEKVCSALRAENDALRQDANNIRREYVGVIFALTDDRAIRKALEEANAEPLPAEESKRLASLFFRIFRLVIESRP